MIAATATFTSAAANGNGQMTVDKTSAPASVSTTFTFTFTNTAATAFSSGSRVTLTVPNGWTTPRTSAGNGRITIANDGCSTGSVSVTGSGPWSVIVPMACPAGQSFQLIYSNAWAGAETYDFTTFSRNGNTGGSGNALAASPEIVLFGAATHLSYVNGPADGVVGSALAPVTVAVHDSGNRVVTSGSASTAMIAMALSGGTGGATLGGTTSVAAVNGIATFSNLTVSRAGIHYHLTASSTGLTSIESGHFDIGRGNQTVTFTSTAPAEATIGGAVTTYTVTAIASSGLTPVDFSLPASSNGHCSISGNVITFGPNPGTCTINAHQDGDTNWNAAPTVSQSFAVKRLNGVHFGAVPLTRQVGGSFALTATSDAGTPVTLTVDPAATAICSLSGSASGSTVSFTGAGTCLINGTAAGNTNYWAASGQLGFSIAKADQTIIWDTTAPTTRMIGGTTYTPAAHSTSGLPVTISINAGSAAYCSMNGSGVVSWTGAGPCQIDATQAGNSNYNPATTVHQTVTVIKRDQAITFDNPGAHRMDQSPFDVSATAGSGLPVTFAASGTCTISDNHVTLTGTGSCTITASQSGDATWAAAADVPQTFEVTQGIQTVTFPNPGAVPMGTPPLPLVATASSGLPVEYTVTAGTCTVDASGLLTVHGVGPCSVTAAQAGDANWLPAANGITLQVLPGLQGINFPDPGPKTFTTPPFDLGASATSGLPVSYAVTAGTCTVSGSTLTIHSTGDCTVQATQPGDANWLPALPVSRTFTVGTGDQTITFPAISDKPFGTAPFALGATASSGLPVTYTVTAGTCTVSGATLTIHGLGDCTVEASQAGDASWTAAEPVNRTFTVVQGTQAITFPAIPTVSLTQGSITLGATASSGLPVSYAVTAGTCTVAGNVLTVHSVGDCTVEASQAGTQEWLPAQAVSRTFTVSAKLVLTITANNQSRALGAANPTFTYAVSGYAAGDNDTAITTKPTCTTTATTASPVGTYPITCSGAASDKYDFTYVAGTLTVATEQVAGATGTPVRSVTPPPTTTSGNGGNGSNTLPFALLICLAFSGFGLLAVTAQRRGIRP